MSVLLLTAILACTSEAPAPEPPPSSSERSAPPELGKWREFRIHQFDETLTAEERAEIAQLEALGYADGTRDAENAETVTKYVAEKTWPGVNLYSSGHSHEAFLVDMDGTVLHTWSRPFWDAFPDYPAKRGAPGTNHYRRVFLLEDGGLLAIFEGRGLLRLDRDSTLLWSWGKRAHHDLHLLENGDLWTLSREAKVVEELGRRPRLIDYLTLLDGTTGKEKAEISLLEAWKNSPYEAIWREGNRKADMFHTNSVERLDGSVADQNPAFQKGNFLLSFRTLDAIAVLDPESQSIVWAEKGVFKKQHDATITRDKTLLVYDNTGAGKRRSRILEYDLSTMEVAWKFTGSQKIPFWSATLGTNQRLPNGNTLITESDGGRAIELTRAREVVWEFYNPHRAGPGDEYVAALFMVERVDRPEWLGSPKP